MRSKLGLFIALMLGMFSSAFAVSTVDAWDASTGTCFQKQFRLKCRAVNTDVLDYILQNSFTLQCNVANIVTGAIVWTSSFGQVLLGPPGSIISLVWTWNPNCPTGQYQILALSARDFKPSSGIPDDTITYSAQSWQWKCLTA